MPSIIDARLDDALRTALGPDVSRYLADPRTTDLLRNADSTLWVDQFGIGRFNTGCKMSDTDTLAALSLISDRCGETLTKRSPILSATLASGERIAGTIWPVTTSPTFAIRKPPESTFPVADYFDNIPDIEEDLLSFTANTNLEKVTWAVRNHRNVLIAGGTGAAKTSLLSALLQDKSVVDDRLVVIEDVHEIIIGSPDHVRMLTSKSAGITQKDLVEISLRQRPDRIIVGEIRSPDAAFQMISALNTGHGGSATTIHASSCARALDRLDSLCASAVIGKTPSKEIANAIHVVVFVRKIKKTGERKVVDVQFVHGWDKNKGYIMGPVPRYN